MRKTAIAVAAVLALSGAVSTASAERNFWVGAGLSGSFAADLGAGPIGMGIDDESVTFPWLGGGFNVFYDILYGFVEVNAGMLFANATPTLKDGNTTEKGDSTMTVTSFTFGVMARLPIYLNENEWVLFPMIGVEYALSVAARGDGWKLVDPDPVDLSQLWICGGVGMEIPLSDDLYILDRVYLRAEVLYAYGLPSRASNDRVDNFNENLGGEMGLILETIPSHRVTAKLGIGFKF